MILKHAAVRQYLGKGTNYPNTSNCPSWAIRNPEFKLLDYIENPTRFELKEVEVRKIWDQHQAPPHPLNQFTFDTSNVSSQIATINTLGDQYYVPLISGMAGDVDKAIEELRNQLKQAGMDDVIAEAQRQIEQYASSIR